MWKENFVSFVILTFVCTGMITIINDKSNMERFICIFKFRKQVSASALITSDNFYKRNYKIRVYISTNKKYHNTSSNLHSLLNLPGQAVPSAGIDLGTELDILTLVCISWCLRMNDVLVPAVYLARCPLLLVYMFLEASPLLLRAQQAF